MDKKKRKKAVSGNPAAAQLAAKMKRVLFGKGLLHSPAGSGESDAELLRAKAAALEVSTPTTLAHAAYIIAQNQVSVIAEQITGLKEMAPFYKILEEAEDLYMPSGPPMSPLTTSFFTCWAFFDACAGPFNQTIGTTILTHGAALGLNTELLRLIGLMQESRMGLYLHQGVDGDVAVLDEFVTGEVRRAMCPAGYPGTKGELWYVRVLPPPYPDNSDSTVFTSPYILLKPGLYEWLEYFRRTFPATATVADYKNHMKYGPTRNYWNDFVFEAYFNYKLDRIYLAGLPDVAESRPHSQVNSR